MTDGAVFHPGHDELHGQTVVLYTNGPRTFIGRWDMATDEMVKMVGASMHDAGDSELSRDEWVAQTKTFGVAVEHQVLTIPRGEVTEIKKLRDA